MTDAELESAQISRMWDLLASDEEYREANEWVGGFTNQLDQTRPYSTREFLHLLGRELAEIASEDGVLTSAYKARVPIFCPAIADSGIAVGIAGARFEKKNNFMFDIVQDVLDMMNVTARASHRRHQSRRRHTEEFSFSNGSDALVVHAQGTSSRAQVRDSDLD
jgi:deoxyhypusine synthase